MRRGKMKKAIQHLPELWRPYKGRRNNPIARHWGKAATWRQYTDRFKHSPLAMRLADRLGRGRGRMRWLDSMDRTPPAAPVKPDFSNWNDLDLAAAWIGHATVLLRMGGMSVLTDPVFSNRVGIGVGLMTAGPKRQFAPACKLGQLPHLDLILISHAHFDHLDRPTLIKLNKKIPVITAPGTKDLIEDLGFHKVTELKWDQTTHVKSLAIRAQQVRHWGARTFYDVQRGYNGYFLSSNHNRIFYAGDTAHQEYLRNTGHVDLAIFGIGAYDPFIQAHANPEEVWRMTDDVRAEFLMPIHHSTYRLSHEPMAEPIERMLLAAGNESDRVVATKIGDMWNGS